MRSMIFVPVAVLTLAALLGAPAAAQAQTNVGVVDFQQALIGTAEVQKEAARVEAKFKPRQDEVGALTKELQELQQKLQSATGDQAAQLQADGQRKQRNLQRLSEDLQTDFEFDRNSILQAAAQKMRDALKTVAEAKGLDLITEASSTYYFKPTLDVTADATAAYDKAHPVTAASPPAGQ
ncbi:MAG: OmpH family outer membrane protein [Bryobacterales bacterium]